MSWSKTSVRVGVDLTILAVISLPICAIYPVHHVHIQLHLHLLQVFMVFDFILVIMVGLVCGVFVLLSCVFDATHMNGNYRLV